MSRRRLRRILLPFAKLGRRMRRGARGGRRLIAAALSFALLINFLVIKPAYAEDPGELTITKGVQGWDDGHEVQPGETFEYTIVVTCSNSGSGGCTNATLSDSLPDGISLNTGASDITITGATGTSSATDDGFTIDFTDAQTDPPGAESRRWAEDAISFATPRGWAASPRLAYAYLMAAWSAFQTGESERQRKIAELGMKALDGVNNIEVELGVRSMHALAVFESSTGDERRGAVRVFHRLWSDPRAEQASPALTGHAGVEEVRLALAIGEFGWATEAVQRIKGRLPNSAEAAVMNAELLLAQGRPAQVLDVLAPAIKGKLAVHLPASLVIANVMTAFLEHQRGNVTRGLAALERALGDAAPQNLQRPFIDAWQQVKPVINIHAGQFGRANEFVASLMDRERPAQDTADGELLSPKQLELLRDLQAVLPVRKLAAARGVSVNTTRTHLRAVYRKLGVSSRSEAVQVARDRGLL